MTSLDFLQTRERFLPIHPQAIVERVLADPRLSGEEREQLGHLYEMIGARFHYEFHRQIEELKALYDPFDPDRDTLPLGDLTPAERQGRCAELSRRIAALLVGGNYVELTRDQLRACLEAQTHCKLSIRVNLDEYQDLRVFYRGVRDEEQTIRDWNTLWLAQKHKVRVLKRVALFVRTAEKKGDHVRVKLFKDLVVEDLKIIHPQPILRMTWLDRVKVSSSVAGALGTALWKPLTMLFTAVAFSPVVAITFLVGFFGAILRGVYGFMNNKTKYMKTLSSSLYYQNLANNASALARLVDEAEAEEAKEMILAYFILYVERDRGYMIAELDRRVEEWLRREFQIDADFEVGDAVRKLEEKDLLVERVAAGPDGQAGAAPRRVLKVYDLPSTLRRLDKAWDECFLANNHGSGADDRLADADWPPPPRAARACDAA